MNEIWKDIPGYEGCYQASTLGRIKSLEGKVARKNPYTGKKFMRRVPQRILKSGEYYKSGHLSVVLEHHGVGRPVHQLVMKTFVGEPPDGMEVLHINGNPKDNRLENLRYGTRTENVLDVYYQGGKWRKLSIDDVQAIRFELFCGISGIQLSQQFGVSPQVISKIKCGRLYTWLK